MNYLVITLLVLGKIVTSLAVPTEVARAASRCSSGYGFNITAGDDNKCYKCTATSLNPETSPCLDCAEDHTKCKKCIPYMGVTAEGGCANCPMWCVRCDLNKCSECHPGYFLDSDGQCKSCSSEPYNPSPYLPDPFPRPEPPCLNSCTYDKCKACPVGTGLNPDTGRCGFCEGHCRECSQNYKICTECGPNEHLVNGECKYCSMPGCAACHYLGETEVCTECWSWDYALVNGQCIQCPNCADCQATGNVSAPVVCNQCDEATYQDPNNPAQCLRCDLWCDYRSCQLINGKPVCTKCREDFNNINYRPVGGICKKLTRSCAQGKYVTDPSGKKKLVCAKCDPGFRLLKNNTCLSKKCATRTKNCAECNAKACTQCQKGYYLYPSSSSSLPSCVQCPKNTKTCEWSPTQGRPISTSCYVYLQDGVVDSAVVLIDGLCYKSGAGCITAIANNSKPYCTECGEGYALIDGVCTACGVPGKPNFCTKCVNVNNKPVCQQCVAYHRLTASKKCVPINCGKLLGPSCRGCQQELNGNITCVYYGCPACNNYECYALDENKNCTIPCTPCWPYDWTDDPNDARYQYCSKGLLNAWYMAL